MQRVEVLFGAELADFIDPVSSERGRTHHQRRHGAAVCGFSSGILLRPEHKQESTCTSNLNTHRRHVGVREATGCRMDSVPEVMISSKDADGLQSLSETHVVAQDPVQLIFVQEREPVHAVLQRRKRPAKPERGCRDSRRRPGRMQLTVGGVKQGRRRKPTCWYFLSSAFMGTGIL